MPLLKGKFDPKKFNSTTLAAEFRVALVDYLHSEAGMMFLVDVSQQVIERMVAEKVVE